MRKIYLQILIIFGLSVHFGFFSKAELNASDLQTCMNAVFELDQARVRAVASGMYERGQRRTALDNVRRNLEAPGQIRHAVVVSESRALLDALVNDLENQMNKGLSRNPDRSPSVVLVELDLAKLMKGSDQLSRDSRQKLIAELDTFLALQKAQGGPDRVVVVIKNLDFIEIDREATAGNQDNILNHLQPYIMSPDLQFLFAITPQQKEALNNQFGKNFMSHYAYDPQILELKDEEVRQVLQDRVVDSIRRSHGVKVEKEAIDEVLRYAETGPAKLDSAIKLLTEVANSVLSPTEAQEARVELQSRLQAIEASNVELKTLLNQMAYHARESRVASDTHQHPPELVEIAEKHNIDLDSFDAQRIETMIDMNDQLIHEIRSVGLRRIDKRSVDAEAVRFLAEQRAHRAISLDELYAKLPGMEAHLNKIVLNQEVAVHDLVLSVQGWVESMEKDSDLNKPQSTLFRILLGTTGVGKSYLAEQAAIYLFGEDGYVSLDGGQFTEGHSKSAITGATAGYTGYGDETILARFKRGLAALIPDEMEKMHVNVHDVWLTWFQRGYGFDSRGNRIRIPIAWATSNVGAEIIRQTYFEGITVEVNVDGQTVEMYFIGEDIFTEEFIQYVLNDELNNHPNLRVEFLGRQQGNPIVLRPFTREQMAELMVKNLSDLVDLYSNDKSIELEFSEETKQLLLSLSNSTYGARGFENRVIRPYIREPLAALRVKAIQEIAEKTGKRQSRELTRGSKILITTMENGDLKLVLTTPSGQSVVYEHRIRRATGTRPAQAQEQGPSDQGPSSDAVGPETDSSEGGGSGIFLEGERPPGEGDPAE